VSLKTFTGAVAVAALAWSSSVGAQTPSEEPLTKAKALLSGVSAPPQSEAARLIATLKQDFIDFAAAYLTPASPVAVGTTGVAGASSAEASRADWRPKYFQVEADLASLLDTASTNPSSSGIAFDPSTRATLENVRSQLQRFYATTLSAPGANPVAHTGAAQAAPPQAAAASGPPIAPTAEAPQTAPQPAAGAATPGAARPMPQVEADLGMALTLLDRMKRILDEATTDPGKLKLDRGDVDEIRAEINQIRAMLRGRQLSRPDSPIQR